jgi:hypothetical protein
VDTVLFSKRTKAQITIGRSVEVKTFSSSGAITILETLNPHCLLTGNKIILFASEENNGGAHAIADGQAYLITKTSATQFSINLDTSNCSISEGIYVVPEDLSLYWFSATVKPSTPTPIFVGTSLLTADGKSQYLKITTSQEDDLSGLVPGRVLYADGIVEGTKILAISNQQETTNSCFVKTEEMRSIFIDRLPIRGETKNWRTQEATSQLPSISVATDLATSTLTLSIAGNPGKYSFDLYQKIIGTEEGEQILSGEWEL